MSVLNKDKSRLKQVDYQSYKCLGLSKKRDK